jgi:hypothetical protein
MGTPKLDSHKILHWTETEKSLPDGHEEVEVREVVPGAVGMIRPDKPGFEEWSHDYDYRPGDIRKRKVLVPNYRTKIERTAHYESQSEQLLQVEKEIATLGKRERFKRQGPFAWKEKVRTIRDPYLWREVSDRRVDQFLEEILDRPEYQPVEIQLPKGKPWVPGKKSGKRSKKK